MAEYSDALDYFVDPGRTFIGQNSREVLVLHGTGGNPNQSVEELGGYFRSTTLKTSSHFGIGRDGRIAQYVRLADGAAANCCVEAGYDPFWSPYLDRYGNLNLCTISIEHINDEGNSLLLTDAQQHASFRLIAWLCQRYSIPFERIKPHASLLPKDRARCPGPLFPWAELKTFLASGETQEESMLNITDPFAKQYFKEIDSHTWECTANKQRIAYGILGFYRRLNGKLRLPLTGEFQIVPRVTAQLFEGGIVAYDPSRTLDNPPGQEDCYLVHIESGPGQALLAKALVDPLNAEVDSLNKQVAHLLDEISASQESAELARLRGVLQQIYALADPAKV